TVVVRVTGGVKEIRVEVLDTGTGISTKHLPKLFNDFYRINDTETTGTGLGLSISKRIVEAHGGRIFAESPNPEDSLARGSRFVFILPNNLFVSAKGKRKGKKRVVNDTRL
ncbi:sensor histidine kinase, partial [Chloroflexota bacterium]